MSLISMLEVKDLRNWAILNALGSVNVCGAMNGNVEGWLRLDLCVLGQVQTLDR